MSQRPASIREPYSTANTNVWYVFCFLFRVRELPILTSYFADGLSSLNTLLEALDNLDAVCDSVEEKYLSSLQDGRYERWEEKS